MFQFRMNKLIIEISFNDEMNAMRGKHVSLINWMCEKFE